MSCAIRRRNDNNEAIGFLQKWFTTVLIVLHNLLVLEGCSKKEAQFALVKVSEVAIALPQGELICNSHDLVLDGKGNFYIVDRKCHRVWALTKNGKYIRTIGGQGQGPGELGGPVSISIQGDTLAVLEAGNRRLSFFGLDGVYHTAIHLSVAGRVSGAEVGKGGRFIVSESL
ncbi:6-bladed beta-propeller, partial [bacterium]|nr:6-bladed beta-propeller [bacterium]